MTSLFLFICSCFIFVNLTQERILLETEILVKKIPPTDWPTGKSIEYFHDFILICDYLPDYLVPHCAEDPELSKKAN